jgi:signal transduction histidine kinase/CheY-like chemotaxis protein
MSSETSRLNAARLARDTGEPQITSRIQLVQDGKSRPGFLLYVPAYKPGQATATLKQRKAAFIGFSYAPFITELFIDGAIGDKKAGQINLAIYDKESPNPSTLVYSNTTDGDDHSPSKPQHVSALQIGGYTFTLTWQRGDRYEQQNLYAASIAGITSALFTCLLALAASKHESLKESKKIVEMTTNQLSEANQRLQSEIEVRRKAQIVARQSELKANAASEAKSDFLATMSHEIRTPLNSIIGFSELLANSQMAGKQASWIEYIQTSSNTLLSLINDILDVSKIGAGKMKLEQIPFCLKKVVAEAVGCFSLKAAEKQLTLTTEIEDNIPESVLGDPIRITQIITNLVNNALKFTDHGRINIHLSWEGNQTEGTARIAVSDTGIGIPMEMAQTLFKKFTQADESTTRKYGGTGLGLSICQMLTALMNGEIEIKSTEGIGTQMIVTLPFHVPLELKHQTRHTKSNAPTSAKPHGDILLVDDNALNQKLGSVLLKNMGYNVTLANNGKEAIQHLKQRYYPLIFMDCRMPILDGYQATKKIRTLEARNQLVKGSDNKKISIVALTANASVEDRKKCKRAGMDDYMCKPYQIVDFQKMVDLYMN